ncbi:MAG TPA: PH domain-containing protein [Gammaproteobacteria bacterium]
MPSENAAGFVPDRRLHRLSWLFVAIGYLKQFLFAIAGVVFLGAQNDYALWALLGVIPLLASAAWQQWIYRYGFGPRGLVIHEGLFFRNVRNIDYQRVENIDTERHVLHRLFGVAEVRIETSSGGSSEAVIRVLSLQAVREMRDRIFAEQQGGEPVVPAESAPEPAAETVLLRLRAGELVRYGLIDNRGMIIVAAIIGLFAEVGRQEAIERYVQPVIDRFPLADFAAVGATIQVLLVVSAIAGLVAGTRILSVLLALVTLHDFRLSQSNDDLRVRYGLLTRISLTLRRPRIQAVHQTESLLHRLFRRVSLRVDLAGGATLNDQQHNGQPSRERKLWLAPVCTKDKAAELVRSALPQVSLEGLDWQRLSPRARWRLFRLLAALWLLLAAPPAFWLLGVFALAVVLPVLPLLWLYAHLYVKCTGWALHDDFLVLRRGWLTRRQSVVPRNRIQSVRVTESPFDRRYRMAGLDVDTAGASTARMRIPFLDHDTARSLAAALYALPAR